MTDKAYRAWIQTLPSCLDGKSFSEWLPDTGEWRNPACHVRRAGRSGIAFKEEYACIPMTHAQHDYQHRYGELACLVKFMRDAQPRDTLLRLSPIDAERMAAGWFDGQVNKYRELWCERTGTAPWETTEHANA